MPVLRRPDDRRRDLRRLALRAIATSEPDQDRHLMTVATHLASQRRSPQPPAARRNKSETSARGRQSSLDRRERLAPAHRRHRKRPPSPLFRREHGDYPAAYAPLASGPRSSNPHSRARKTAPTSPRFPPWEAFERRPQRLWHRPQKGRRPKPFTNPDISCATDTSRSTTMAKRLLL